MNWFHWLANPARFMRFAARLQPWIMALGLLTGAAGLYFGLFASPADYQQGETVRIMYVHVPSAWMAMFIYVVMAAAAGSFLIWKHPLADVAAQAAAPVGAGFTLMALITGALWGQPMWGTWWVWDARLTSVLILFFLYLGYIALVNAFDDPERGSKAGAILLLVGVVNIPIIKFSVDWWNTLHQPASVARMDGPSVDPSMLLPLLLMAGAFKLYFLYLLIVRMRGELTARRIRLLRLSDIA
ncbi:heme ABC transporter permease [Nisaea nitritireducens]|uniref:heme ABC transporter permease n=1 Tax=Nisaea nitritireducens TaxID=568392 RepID=UPI001866B02D|nr:heme ABC transporter permease [Nisaea nitritireducens]